MYCLSSCAAKLVCYLNVHSTTVYVRQILEYILTLRHLHVSTNLYGNLITPVIMTTNFAKHFNNTIVQAVQHAHYRTHIGSLETLNMHGKNQSNAEQ